MDLITAINLRTSVRRFNEKPVDHELLTQLVDAGRRAPSARNEQPIEFVVITDLAQRQRVAALTEYGKFIAQAPACVMVISRDVTYYLEDGCAAVENILLTATALGLASCWVAGDKKSYGPDLLAVVQAPSDFKLVAMVAIGYADADLQPKEKKPIANVLHWQRYNLLQ